MAVGLTANMTVSSVNQQAGAILQNLVGALDQAAEFQVFLNWYGAANLQTLGFSSADAAIIVSAYTDAFKIYQLYRGQTTLATAYDFSTFIKQLTAMGVH